MDHHVVFLLDELRCCIPLSRVERVVPVMEITPLPGAPRVILGLINLRGSVIPVIDCRQRFGLGVREPLLSDQLVIVRAKVRTAALLVDQTAGVADVAVEQTAGQAGIPPHASHVAGVARLRDGLVVINDVDAFLTAAEEAGLEEALQQRSRRES